MRKNYKRLNVNIAGQSTKEPSRLFLIVFGAFLSWQIYGIFGAIPGLRGIFMIITASVSVFLAIIYTPNFFNKAFFEQKGWLILLTISLVFLVDYIADEDFSYMQFFIPLCVYFCAYVYLREKKVSKGFTLWIMLNIIFKIVITFLFYKDDPLIVKHYDHIGYASVDGIKRSIVGYSSIYLITPCVLLFLAYFFCKKTKYRKSALITAILSVVIIYMSQVSAMIFSMTLLFVLLFIAKGTNVKNKKSLIIMILIFTLLLWLFAVPILNYVSKIEFLGPAFQNRVEGLIGVINGGMGYVDSTYTDMLEGDSVVNRFYSYEKSFEAFSHNFFLGKLTTDALAGEGHSQIIDMMSTYGIFSVLPWILFVLNTYKINVNKYKNSVVEVSLIYGYILLISILNNFGVSAVAMISLIMIPQFLGEIEENQ